MLKWLDAFRLARLCACSPTVLTFSLTTVLTFILTTVLTTVVTALSTVQAEDAQVGGRVSARAVVRLLPRARAGRPAGLCLQRVQGHTVNFCHLSSELPLLFKTRDRDSQARLGIVRPDRGQLGSPRES